MDFILIIFIAATVSVTFENANAKFDAEICMVQLKYRGSFSGGESSTDAFKHAYDHVCVPESRLYENTRGILYEYLDHLYNAAGTLCERHIVLDNPLDWCKANLHKFRSKKRDTYDEDCKKLMGKAGFNGTVEEAMHLSFYLYSLNRHLSKVAFAYFGYIRDTIATFLKHTNAKGPKEFCDEYNFDVSEYPVEIVEEFVFDISQVQYEPPPIRKDAYVHEPNEHYDIMPNPDNKYFVLDSSLRYVRSLAQQSEHAAHVSNQQESVSSTPVNQDENTSSDDEQEGTSTSYKENTFRFDLNKSPPKD